LKCKLTLWLQLTFVPLDMQGTEPNSQLRLEKMDPLFLIYLYKNAGTGVKAEIKLASNKRTVKVSPSSPVADGVTNSHVDSVTPYPL